MKKMILASVEDAVKAIQMLKEPNALDFMQKAAEMIANAFRDEKKLVIAGNGGSMCDAMHFAEEFTGFFRNKRKPLPAIALCEVGHLSCVSNDEGYDFVFSRSAEAYLQKGDIFIALTTSGNSQNLINAFLAAKKKGAYTIAFLGKTGGKMKGMCDLEIVIEGFKFSDRIQEAHMTMGHIIIEMVEKLLFSPEEILKKIQKTQAKVAI